MVLKFFDTTIVIVLSPGLNEIALEFDPLETVTPFILMVELLRVCVGLKVMEPVELLSSIV